MLANGCSETVCAASHTGAVKQAECLRSLTVQSLMSVFPWKAWLNEHFYGIPLPAESSTAIAIADGTNNVKLFLNCLSLHPQSTFDSTFFGLFCFVL